MPMLARYHRQSGQIVGVWTAPYRDLLLAQQTQDDATYGSLEVEDQEARVLETQMEVREGQLVARQVLTLQATLDGQGPQGEPVCYVTLEPWQPCTLRVRGRAYALTETQRSVAIPFETAGMLEITLAPMPGYWAPAVQVERPVSVTEED